MSASEEGRRVLRRSLLIRAGSAPISAVLGVANSALIVAATGAPLFGVITLISTVAQQLPFADLGVGGVVTTAVAKERLSSEQRGSALATIRRALRVLFSVAAILVLSAITVTLLRGWSVILASPLSAVDSWLICAAISIFALNVPLSLVQRVITGLGKNEIVVVANAASSFVIIAATAILALSGSSGLAYALPSVLGPLCVNLVLLAGLVWRLGLGRFRNEGSAEPPPPKLLAGAAALLVINVGLPLGLQSGRYVVAHQSSPDELATFALAMQIYTAAWGILAVASSALWSAYVGLRGDITGTVTLWSRSTVQVATLGLAFGIGVAIGGPSAVQLISGGQVHANGLVLVGFAFLLLAQSIHLSAGAMLTKPTELRWQAGCVMAMALTSLTLSMFLVPIYGAAGAAFAPAIAVIVCQVVPDLSWGRVLVGRRFTGEDS